MGLATPALADPSPADVETARTLYRDGKIFRDKGNLNEALAKFKAAYALAPTPITGLELGRTHIQMGHIMEGREVLLSIERMPKAANESDKAAESRAEAAEIATAVQNRIAQLSLSFEPQPAQTPDVTIDDAHIPAEAVLAPRRVDPGHHVVVARLGDASGRAEVDVGEGEAKAVTVTLVVKKQPPPLPPPPPPSGKSPLLWAGLATVGVGVTVGTITGLMALSKASDVKKECPNGQCPPAFHGDLTATNTLSTVSTIAFLVGGGGVVLTVVGFFMGGSSKPQQARVTPMLGPGSFGLQGRF